MNDKVKALKPQVEVSPEQATFISLMRELYEAAQEGFLKELHGVAIYLEEGEVSRVVFGSAGDVVANCADIACDLYDLGDAIREERREALEDEDDD